MVPIFFVPIVENEINYIPMNRMDMHQDNEVLSMIIKISISKKITLIKSIRRVFE